MIRMTAILCAFCLAATVAVSCGGDNGAGSLSYSCDATVELTPSRIGSVTTPGGRGTGSGSGSSQAEALGEALKVACSKLDLDAENRRKCENNQEFGVTVRSGNITLVSPGAVSWDCRGGN